jgi:alkanesulfonate monooxygenase SsuD/methylene tetrahydromethanopterin reductase-like flavin-dependent oxidoreductase (luciferase family)
MPRDIWFGVHAAPEGRDFEAMKNICRTSEKNNFELFTITDHLMNMRNPNGPSNHPLECWTLLAGIAVVSDKIKLGPLVSCYGYRHPTILAKMATTVDIISGGRLIFGIGAGWHEEEFKGFIGRFPSKGERLRGLRESLEICKNMFKEERTSYKGKIFTVENVLNSPQPIQNQIPIMVGGGGEKVTLKIAAEHADISHFFARDPKSLDTKLFALQKHCKEVGRNYDDLRKGVGFGVLLGESKSDSEKKLRAIAEKIGRPVEQIRTRIGPALGKPVEVADSLKDYTNKGIGLVTCSFYLPEDIPIFAKEIISQF